MKSFRLIVFVKNEEEGRVKTRLASAIGVKEALRVYQLLLKHTMVQIKALPHFKEIWYSNFIEENDLWTGPEFEKKLQHGKDLGERMKAAFGEAFNKHQAERVVLIGSDCAELTAAVITEAFEQLSQKEVVIGPATDGGYYMVGMNRYIPELFDGIAWSTSSVLDNTLAKLKESGASYCLLELLNDVDTHEDWERAKTKLSRV